MPTGIPASIGATRIEQRRNALYRLVKVAQPDEWRYEHQVVAEQMLGRLLKSTELVHHKDDNGLNNDPTNLEVYDRGDHTREHLTITTWAKKYDACISCGTTERKHLGQGLCSRCYQRVPGRRWKDKSHAG